MNESWTIGVWKPCILPPIYTHLANAFTSTVVKYHLQVMLNDEQASIYSTAGFIDTGSEEKTYF